MPSVTKRLKSISLKHLRKSHENMSEQKYKLSAGVHSAAASGEELRNHPVRYYSFLFAFLF